MALSLAWSSPLCMKFAILPSPLGVGPVNWREASCSGLEILLNGVAPDGRTVRAAFGGFIQSASQPLREAY